MPPLDAPYPVSQFSSVVRHRPVRAVVRRVRRSVPANAVPCIPRGPLLRVPVRLALDPLCRLRALPVPAAVLERQRAVPASVTFPVA